MGQFILLSVLVTLSLSVHLAENSAQKPSLCPEQLIVNGNFEVPVVSRRSSFHGFKGWSTTLGQRYIEIGESKFYNTNLKPYQVVQLDAHTNMLQDVKGLTKNGKYQFTLFYANKDGKVAAQNGLRVYWGGSKITTIVPAEGNQVMSYQTLLVAGDEREQLELVGDGNLDGNGIIIIKVSLCPIAEADVARFSLQPVPTSLTAAFEAGPSSSGTSSNQPQNGDASQKSNDKNPSDNSSEKKAPTKPEAPRDPPKDVRKPDTSANKNVEAPEQEPNAPEEPAAAEPEKKPSTPALEPTKQNLVGPGVKTIKFSHTH